LNATTAPHSRITTIRRAQSTVRRVGWAATPPARTAAVGLASACPVAGLGLGSGGYFPTAWGWGTLWFTWLVVLALVLRQELRLDRRSAAGLAALAVLVGWIALSVTWARDVPAAILEAERAAMYLLGFAAVILCIGRRGLRALAGGLLGGVTVVCVVALGTRLLPGEDEGLQAIFLNRLSDPVGYWNALGLLAAMGIILAVVLAARARAPASRALSAATVPVLAATLYFTYSRGGWLALAAGLAVAVALDPRRLQLLPHVLVAGAVAGIGVWIASGYDGLTRLTAAHALIEREGRQMIAVLAVLVVAAAAAALALAAAQRRAPPLRARQRRALERGLAAAVIVASISVVAAYGGPAGVARKGYDSFTREPVGAVDVENLNARLFTLQGEGRIRFWRVVWRDHRAHPWAGAGAGGFEQVWQRDRPLPTTVRDAHSLYVETLHELGWIGATLLLAALAVPLAAARRARLHPLGVAGAGVLVAYVVAASVDWVWEMPIITVTALAAAAMLLIAARDRSSSAPRRPRNAMRMAAATALLVVAGLSLVWLAGHRAAAAAGRALDEGRPAEAVDRAGDAIRWTPWSHVGHQVRGNAEARLGRFAAARRDLREAARKAPGEWRVWFDLGNASSGAERFAAWRRAARLNPLEEDIRVVRRIMAAPGMRR
jgi:O-antigen ligase